MAATILAGAASSWAVLMGIAPVLQIRRMLRERSSRQVSVGYFAVLLVGFLLWISYGIAARNPAAPFSRELSVIGDRKIPYDLLLTVLYTAGQAELENYRFVVLQKGEAGEG